MTKAKNIEKFLIVFLILIVLSLSVSFSVAFFKFSKQFNSSGDLPILNINKIVQADENVFEDNGSHKLRYSLNDVNFSVKLTTENNNIDGYVRVYVVTSWVDGLSNTGRNNENVVVPVCKLNFNEEVWEIKGDEISGYHYYLKNNAKMLPNETIELFSSISFDNDFSSNYYNKMVEITIIAEICQTTNIPENW